MTTHDTEMSPPTASDEAGSVPSRARLLARSLPKHVGSLLAWGVLLFAAAGTLGWMRGWIHLALLAATIAANLAFLLAVNPAILASRMKRHKAQETFDKILRPMMRAVLLMLPALAGLDAARFGWTRLPTWTVPLGIALHTAGNLLVVWTMLVNPFLEKKVRIQKDRGHRVVTSGPYRFVRHPMYGGIILMYAAIPLILGSCWTFLGAGLLILLVAVRTECEDRTLHEELPGYRDYASVTRYRLLPGLW